MNGRPRIAVMLHNVRSSHNVGSIFRTADAAGAEKVFLSGYTPTPRDRFERVQKDIAKTALGAEADMPWEYHKKAIPLISRLQNDGWAVVAVEQDKRAQGYRTYALKKPTVFVFGNEVRGLSKRIRDASDQIIDIPMYGKKESLNVSVAAGIVLFSAASIS